MSSLNLPFFSSELGFSAYVRKMQAFAMLSEAEEHDLASRWHKHGDLKAAQQLVLSHMRLVIKIAYQFKGYGLPMMDLVSEGGIGLMKAVKKFDANMGCRLATYAAWWIKATIQDYILKSWSTLKIGTSALQKKLFFNLKKIRKNLLQSGEVASGDMQGAIAERLGVDVEHVQDMESSLAGAMVSLQERLYDSDGEESEEMLASIPSEEDDVEDKMLARYDANSMVQKLNRAMSSLSQRERAILSARKLSDDAATLESLSAVYGISRERVRQIEESAISKLRKLLTSSSAEKQAAI